MTELELFVEQAMPHEAGHILVGRILGIPVNGLDHIVGLGASNELVPGNFATRALAPPDPYEFRIAHAQVRDAYIQMVGGGLAGNIVSKLKANHHGEVQIRFIEPSLRGAKSGILDNISSLPLVYSSAVDCVSELARQSSKAVQLRSSV